jgi:hypothetical protein
VNGLKDEIRWTVQSQLPDTVDKAGILARIQQQVLERQKFKAPISYNTKPAPAFPRAETNPQQASSTLWKERQLRDFRRANNTCYYCGDKFDAAHLQKCTERTKPQVNAIVVNDLDAELTEETLNRLEMEDIITAEMGQLSLNAIAGTEHGDSMKIRALVRNKVMLILINSGGSHSFASQSFLLQTGVQPSAATPLQVRVANGELLTSDRHVSSLKWWARGFTFNTKMRVLELAGYDASASASARAPWCIIGN